MDQHFSQKSIGEIGSLYYIKEIFSHRSLKAAVMQNYQHVEDFIEVRNAKIVSFVKHLPVQSKVLKYDFWFLNLTQVHICFTVSLFLNKICRCTC